MDSKHKYGIRRIGLQHRVKACCELRGVQETLAKWNAPSSSSSISAAQRIISSSKKADRRLSNGNDHLRKTNSVDSNHSSIINGNAPSNGFPAAKKSTGPITYSDLCAGVILYACIRYIDSKHEREDLCDDEGQVEVDDEEEDPDEQDCLRTTTKTVKTRRTRTTRTASVDSETIKEEIDVLGGGNYNYYSRIRRHSTPAAGDNKSLDHHGATGVDDEDGRCKSKDVVACRLRNLRAVMRRIQAFYADTLNALIVMPLPDLLLIARNPFPEDSGEEMKKVLLLLLGCAVQSDKKEEFIRKIKELDIGLQQAIVEQIKKVTDTVDCVLNVQALELDPSDRTTATVLHQLQRVIKERDTYANSTLELAVSTSGTTSANASASASAGGCGGAAAGASEHESDGGGSSSASSSMTNGKASKNSSTVCNGDVCQRKLPESQQDVRENSSERHHLAVELADVKAKLRRTRQELEEKIEIASEYREELADKEAALAKIRQENLDLLKDARSAKEYRDELDVLREKVDRLERVENECGKYKERLMELDFCKSRVDELREENHLLLESRHMLESQVDTLNARLHKSASAETELLQAQRLILDLQQEIKSEREKVGDIFEQNIQLEKECQESLNKSSTLEKELSQVKATLNGARDSDGADSRTTNGGTLSDQLNESAHSKILKLELDNQRLRSQLDETSTRTSQIDGDLRTENETLRKQLDERSIKDNRESIESHLKQQRHELERNFRHSEEQYRREIDDLKTENTSLTDELSLTRDRYDDSLSEERKRITDEYESTTGVLLKDRDELRSKKEEISAENKRLAQELARAKTDLARAQDRQLENEKEKLANENRLYSLDRESRCAEKENAKLKQMLESADDEFEKARTRIVELEREKQKLESSHAKLEKAEEAAVGLEIEKRHFAQQAELETKKCAALREDLVKEKTQTHDLKKKLHTILHSLGVNAPETLSNDACSQADILVQERLNNFNRDRDDLRDRLQELELREKQQSELIVSQTSEISHLRSKLASKIDNDQSSTNEKLKDLERANGGLVDENKNVKQQVYLLQEELRKMQQYSHSGQSENGMLRQEINELRLQMSSNANAQTDNAKLQVETRSLQLQVDVLEQDNTELQKQCGQWERDHGLVRRDFEHLQRQHGGLLQDHEQLQNIHEQLSGDFEKLQNEVLILKSQMRQLKHNCADHSDQLERLSVEKERLSTMQGRFEQERFEKEREFKTFALLQNEHSSVKKNYDDLKARYDFLTNEIDHMRSDYRNLRLDYNAISLKSTHLQAQLTDSQDLAQRKELESVKLMHKCEMYTQLNSTLEEESRTLLRQMDVLIAQNQGLLTRALMDKDQYHAESKEFLEKLNALRRHKEKLEEKIMEQYKTMDSPSKRKEKLTFMKKAKALVSRPSSRKSRPSKHSINSGSAAEDSAMSADEGGFFSTSSRLSEQPYNGQQQQQQNGYARLSSRLRDRAESTDSRRSESSSSAMHTQADYVDIVRASPSLSGTKSGSRPTPVQQRRQFPAASPLNSPEISHKRSHSSASTHGAESSLSSGTTAASSGGSSGACGGPPSLVLSKATNGGGSEKKDTAAPPLITLPPFAPTGASQNGTSLIPDHVSLTGSERAVDVPNDFLAHQPPAVIKSSGVFNTYGSSSSSSSTMGKSAPPPYVPPRASSQQSGTGSILSCSAPIPPSKPYQHPPPPPSSSSANSTISTTTTTPGSPLLVVNRLPSLVNKARPPPPPYPGPTTRRQPPPLPNGSSSTVEFESASNLSRFRPDLAAEDHQPSPTCSSSALGKPMAPPTSLNVLADSSFAPAQTSTPNSDQRFLFDPQQPADEESNAVMVYPNHQNGTAAASSPPYRLFCATGNYATVVQHKEQSPTRQIGGGDSSTPQYRQYGYSNPYRKTAAQSFYENIEDLQATSNRAMAIGSGDGSPPVADDQDAVGVNDTSSSTVIPEPARDSIWYEYGCV